MLEYASELRLIDVDTEILNDNDEAEVIVVDVGITSYDGIVKKKFRSTPKHQVQFNRIF